MLNSNILPNSWRFVKERRRNGNFVETKGEKEKAETKKQRRAEWKKIKY